MIHCVKIEAPADPGLFDGGIADFSPFNGLNQCFTDGLVFLVLSYTQWYTPTDDIKSSTIETNKAHRLT